MLGPYHICTCTFLPLCGLSFTLLNCLSKNIISFDEVQFFNVLTHGSHSGSCAGNLCLAQGYKDLLLLSFRSFIVSGFTFRSMTHFD